MREQGVFEGCEKLGVGVDGAEGRVEAALWGGEDGSARREMAAEHGDRRLTACRYDGARARGEGIDGGCGYTARKSPARMGSYSGDCSAFLFGARLTPGVYEISDRFRLVGIPTAWKDSPTNGHREPPALRSIWWRCGYIQYIITSTNMNRKFATIFAIVCMAAAIFAVGSVVYRISAADRAGREAAKADFEGLRSVLAYVKSQADLADPGLRARLASRYEASPGILVIDVYERGSGEVWRIPANSPYMKQQRAGAPEPVYPAASTLLLSAPLKGDSSGKLAIDALYTSLPQAAVFEAFRDALIGLGAFLAIAALVLTLLSGKGRKEAELGAEETREPSDEEEPSAEASELAAAAAHYQFATLGAEQEEEFDIPIMGNSAESQTAKEGSEAGARAAEDTSLAGSSEERLTEDSGKPEGLYSPASGLGWESYMAERLDAELSRSASFDQDLSLLFFSCEGLRQEGEDYRKIGEAIKETFNFRDLAFEREGGFSIILPNLDSSHAIKKAEEFRAKLGFLAGESTPSSGPRPLSMGISSRAGRLVDAQRLGEEAEAALARARSEKDSHTVAFKPDPDKYRRYLASKEA